MARSDKQDWQAREGLSLVLLDKTTEQERKKPAGWLKPWLGPLAGAGLVFVLAALALALRGPLMLDIGGDDRLDLNYLATGQGGFFAPEKQVGPDFPPGYDPTYRWTGPQALINLPWPLDAVPLKATLRAAAPRPGRPPDQPGTTLTITGRLGHSEIGLGQYPVTGRGNGDEISFSLPTHLKPGLDRFALQFDFSDTYQPGSGDTRNLAAVFFGLRLQPDWAAFGLKGWLAFLIEPLMLALLSLTVWRLTGFISGRAVWRLGLQGAGGLLLLASLLAWPLAAAPYYAPWLVLLGLVWLLAWLAGRFELAAPTLPAPFIWAGTLLLLMPLAQCIAGQLDFSTTNPGTVALLVYTLALLFGLATYAARPEWLASIFKWSFLAASVIVFVYAHWRVYELNLYRGADFRNYYTALLDVPAGQPLYSLQQMADMPGSAVRMPPGFAVFFWPFAQLFGRDVNSAVTAWRIANELLLVPTVLIFLRIFRRSESGLALWPLVWLVVLNFGQLAETTGYGQQNYLWLFGLALTSYAVFKGRDTLAGLALSGPLWVKLLPAASGGFFLAQRRWRGLLGLVGGAIVMNALTIAAVGWDNVWFYFTKALWSVNTPELTISNQSWWGFMGRLAVHEVAADFAGDYPRWLVPLGYLVAFLAIGLNLYLLWRVRQSTWLTVQLGLGSLALLAVWVAPFSWWHYIVPGVVAIVVIGAALTRPQAPRWQLLLFGLSYVLLAYGGRMEFFGSQAYGLNLLGSSYHFLATFALWALNCWLVFTATAQQQDKA